MIYGEVLFMVTEKLKKELKISGISIYQLSKLTQIRYELLRRVFHGTRKLSADEFLLILERTGIDFDKVK